MSTFQNNSADLKIAHLQCIENLAKSENISDYDISVLHDDSKGNNYMGRLIKILLSGKRDNGERIIKNLILKTAPNSSKVREGVPIKQFYSREIYTYNTTLLALQEIQNKSNICNEEKFNFIKCYAAVPIEPDEFVLMDNVNSEGFKICDRQKALDIDHLKLIMKTIARFHSLSLALKKQNPDLYKEIADNAKHDVIYSEKSKMFINSSIESAIEYIDNAENKIRFLNFANYDRVYNCLQAERYEPFNVLCHGDFWQNNILFKYKDGKLIETRIVDWQLAKNCSPFVDIYHLLFSATDENTRDRYLGDLLNIYHETLISSLKNLECDIEECFPEYIFKEQQNKLLPYGLIYSVVSLTFLMREEDEVNNLEEYVEQAEKEKKLNFRFTSELSMKNFSVRAGSLIKDFVEMNVL